MMTPAPEALTDAELEFLIETYSGSPSFIGQTHLTRALTELKHRRALQRGTPGEEDGERASLFIHERSISPDHAPHLIEHFQAVRADERERCAKVADKEGAALSQQIAENTEYLKSKGRSPWSVASKLCDTARHHCEKIAAAIRGAKGG